jgi:hypothetical protein
MRTLAALLAAGALLAPAAAQAGSITVDRACYVAHEQITVTGAGFRPGGEVLVAAGGDPVPVLPDLTGAFAVKLEAPAPQDPAATAKEAVDVSVGPALPTDADPLQVAARSVDVVNFAFDTTQGVKSPTTKRTWWFSGFRPGAAIYGHFLRKGRLRGTFRFGVAKSPCGMLERRAAGIPVPRRQIRSGTWTVQVDQVRGYRRDTSPALLGSTKVFVKRG